jgi:hypothetical protein
MGKRFNGKEGLNQIHAIIKKVMTTTKNAKIGNQ